MCVAAILPLGLGLELEKWPAQYSATPWVAKIDSGLRGKAERESGPRLIVVGGSNVLFGFDAPRLERRLGIPVIAYGLHAGMGVDVIAERAAQIVRAGDLVLYSPELSQFHRHFKLSKFLRSDFLKGREFETDRGLGQFPLRTWIVARERSQELWEETLSKLVAALREDDLSERDRSPVGAYALKAIDGDGNLVFPRPKTKGKGLKVKLTSDSYDRERFDFEESLGMRGLRILQKRCERTGAQLLVQPGVHLLPEGGDARCIEIEAEWMRLAEESGAQCLLAAGATTFPLSYGYDTRNHLNDKGIALFEDLLVEALSPLIQ